MAKRNFFVTGTDTDVGKTVITAGLIEAANQAALTTAAIKPMAAGCEPTDSGLQNADALILQAAAAACNIKASAFCRPESVGSQPAAIGLIAAVVNAA